MASTPELALFGDAGQTVRALIDEWRRRGNPPREVRGASPTFGEKLPANRIVVTDSGRTLGTLPSLVDGTRIAGSSAAATARSASGSACDRSGRGAP